MNTYSLITWFAFFFFYSFCGWIWEVSLYIVRDHKFVNRGFLKGPFLPIYGSGAVVVLFVTLPFKGNMLIAGIVGCIFASILEYFTGACMEALFKVRYWDYSKRFLNLNGHVCLQASAIWFLFTVILTEFAHVPVERVVLRYNSELFTVFIVFLVIIETVDMTVSIREALDFRDVLIKIEESKEELRRMRKRLDVIMAIISQEGEELKEGIDKKLDELKDTISIKISNSEETASNLFEDVRERMELIKQLEEKGTNIIKEKLYNYKEESDKMKEKYIIMKEERKTYKKTYLKYKNIILSRFPRVKSRKFSEILKEIKDFKDTK